MAFMVLGGGVGGILLLGGDLGCLRFGSEVLAFLNHVCFPTSLLALLFRVVVSAGLFTWPFPAVSSFQILAYPFLADSSTFTLNWWEYPPCLSSVMYSLIILSNSWSGNSLLTVFILLSISTEAVEALLPSGRPALARLLLLLAMGFLKNKNRMILGSVPGFKTLGASGLKRF